MVKKKTVKDLKKEAWKWFSKYIRLSYADEFGDVYCYTCGIKDNWKNMEAGHGIGGRTNNILFDESIVRPQCRQCNIFYHGNYDVFHLRLIDENGVEWFEKKVNQKFVSKSFTPQELEEIIEKYKKLTEIELERVS